MILEIFTFFPMLINEVLVQSSRNFQAPGKGQSFNNS